MTSEDYEKKNRAELEEAKKKLLEDFTKEAAKKDSVSFMEIMAQKMDEAQGTHGKIVVAKMDQEKPCGASSYLQEAFIHSDHKSASFVCQPCHEACEGRDCYGGGVHECQVRGDELDIEEGDLVPQKAARKRRGQPGGGTESPAALAAFMETFHADVRKRMKKQIILMQKQIEGGAASEDPQIEITTTDATSAPDQPDQSGTEGAASEDPQIEITTTDATSAP